MNIALWVLQVLLGAFFVFHTTILLRPDPKRLQQGMSWVLEMPAGLRIFAGVAEGLGGLGLVLPGLLRIAVWLTPLAAAGLVILMVGAIAFHFPRRELPNIGLNIALLVLSATVLAGRWLVQPL